MPSLADILQYPASDSDPLVSSRPPPQLGPIDALRAHLRSNMMDRIANLDKPAWSIYEHPTFAETTKRVLDPSVPFSQNLKEALLTLAPSKGTKVAGFVNDLGLGLMAARGAGVAPRIRGTIGLRVPGVAEPEPIYGWRGSFGYENPKAPYDYPIPEHYIAGQTTPPIYRPLGPMREGVAQTEAQGAVGLAAQGLNRFDATQQDEPKPPSRYAYPMVYN